ncbi:MAG TPA: methyltransferase domain-containing protein [Chloroflexia bacterium]|nr:methyltransferase domain-containing protein [Chloroflexia bacterium]
MPPETNVYDDYAAEYTAMVVEREAHDLAQAPMITELLEAVGDVAGRDVLDAGCGEGYLSRLLAARGARVTGVDVAGRLVSAARARDPEGRITYLVHNLSRPLPDAVGRFDLIASHFVLNDVPDYQGFIATLAAVLRPGGRAVFSMNNPYSFVVRNHIKNYFDSGVAYPYRGMWKQGVKVRFYQHTLQEYMDTFLAAGFRLERLLDIPTPEAMMRSLPDVLIPPGYQFPYFMILSFVKP